MNEETKISYQLYLANDRIAELEKANKELLKRNQLLLDRLIDYANRLGIKIDVKVYGGNILWN